MKLRADRVGRLYKLSKSSLSVSPNFGDIASQNKNAIQLIQNLFNVNQENNNSNTRNIGIVDEALKIYNDTKLQNHTLINSLLKIFSHFKHPEKISNLWNQINILSKDNNAISYPLLLNCCIKSTPSNINEAIQCLEWMKYQNYQLHVDEMQLFSKNVSKLITKSSKDINKIKHIHCLIDNKDDIFIKTALINAYGICANNSNYSLNVFESIGDDKKNNVCIGAIMKVLIDHNKGAKVLDIYDKYRSLIDDISNSLAIKACIISNNYEKGKQIHENIALCFQNNTTLNNVLIDFYSYFGDLTKAANVFHSNDGKNDVISVGTLMKGYINTNYNEQALKLYDDNITLNDDICHVLAIKGCINTNNFEKGQEIEKKLSPKHGIIAKTTLIDFYCHFGYIQVAESIFNSIIANNIDIVAINSMMTGYIGNDNYDKALSLYDEYNILHNDTSHILAVKACTATNDFIKGKYIHSHVINTKYYTLDMKNVLIDFYGSFNDISNALNIFNSMDDKQKDIITINAMMKAYCNVDLSTQCMQLFNNLNDINDKLICDVITFSTALKACTQATLYREGEDIHKILKYKDNKYLLNETMIQTNLINMYGKNGMIKECEKIFNDIKQTDIYKYKTEIAIWNAMINAYGRNGDIENAENIFKNMNEIGIKSDAKTYKILINSLSHCGDAQKAQNIWLYEIVDDNIKYDPFVISSLIDCFCRTGMIFEGYELLLQYENYTMNTNIDDIHKEVMWTSLLSGCKKHNDEIMAERIDEEMKDRLYFMKETSDDNKDKDKDNDNETKTSDTMGTASVLMSNIFGSGADFDKVNEIRAEMKRRGWKKKPGFSEIDVYGTLHRFYAGWGYRKSPEYKIIDKKLENISLRMNEFGYNRDYSAITRQLKDWETPDAVLNRHGEKLAVIYGLLTTQPDYLIVVNKNLRICVDCHNWMKMVSKIEQRKLIIADTNRVHTFEDGKCTCNDYW